MAGKDNAMQTRPSKLLLAAAVCLAAVSLVAGCRKSAQELAEQKAIARHEQDVQRKQALMNEVKGLDTDRISRGAGFLEMLHENGRLPGYSKDAHGNLRLEKPPTISRKGPYYWSLELRAFTQDAPPRNLYFVLVQTYSNSGFQLQKAWREDGSGKVVEEYPIAPAPRMADPRRVFLGPANPGAESGFASWYEGTLGAGSVSIRNEDPATGLNCFSIGVTNTGSGGTNQADLRSEMFPLGRVGNARGPFTFSFAYKLPEKVQPGDNLDVNFRFFDKEGNFLGQEVTNVGSSSQDSAMTRYKTMTVGDIFAPSGAVQADVWVVAGISEPWTSGCAQFDDFSVTFDPPPSWAGILVGIWRKW